MKNILLVCKETYTYPMNFINKDFLYRGYSTEALFIHSSEILLKDPSYTTFIENNRETDIHTFKSIFDEYRKNVKEIEKHINYDYLQYIEKEYCKELPISLLQISSQLFTTAYHYRFFFKPMSEIQKLYWIQLLFQYLIDLMESNHYDMVCDLDIAEIGRSILHLICIKKGVKYVTIEFSRYEDILLPTYTLGRKTDSYFIERYNENNNSKIDKSYIKRVAMFYEKENIMAESYNLNNTAKKKNNSLLQDVKKTCRIIKYLSSTVPNWYKNRSIPVLANPLKSMLFFILWTIRERYLLGQNNIFFDNVRDIKEEYVYFPLHLIPESTTLNKSPFYPNELSVIEAVSKALPVGWKLYVKEHGAMIGERPLSFYVKLKKLTNVKLVRLDCYNDPKPWILKSKGVITLSGTSAFEASLCGKPSLMFGNAYFEILDNITKVKSFEELPLLINNFKTYQQKNTYSQAAYLKTIIECGKKVHFLKLINECERCALKGISLSSDEKQDITSIVDLYLLDFNKMDDMVNVY